MAQLDGVFLTFTSTIMVFSSLQAPLACNGAAAHLRPLDVKAGRERDVSLRIWMLLTTKKKKKIKMLFLRFKWILSYRFKTSLILISIFGTSSIVVAPLCTRLMSCHMCVCVFVSLSGLHRAVGEEEACSAGAADHVSCGPCSGMFTERGVAKPPTLSTTTTALYCVSPPEMCLNNKTDCTRYNLSDIHNVKHRICPI